MIYVRVIQDNPVYFAVWGGGYFSSFEASSRASTCAHEKGHFFKLPTFFNLTNTDPFASWFVVTGDATFLQGECIREVSREPLSKSFHE